MWAALRLNKRPRDRELFANSPSPRRVLVLDLDDSPDVVAVLDPSPNVLDLGDSPAIVAAPVPEPSTHDFPWPADRAVSKYYLFTVVRSWQGAFKQPDEIGRQGFYDVVKGAYASAFPQDHECHQGLFSQSVAENCTIMRRSRKTEKHTCIWQLSFTRSTSGNSWNELCVSSFLSRRGLAMLFYGYAQFSCKIKSALVGT
jgi:hypothetical protein